MECSVFRKPLASLLEERKGKSLSTFRSKAKTMNGCVLTFRIRGVSPLLQPCYGHKNHINSKEQSQEHREMEIIECHLECS